MKYALPPTVTPEALSTIGSAIGLQTQAGREALVFALENVKLLDNKQLDYGSRNISDFGLHGVLVRMNDKLQRIIHLTSTKRRKAVNESLRDSFRDIANYSTIALMIDAGKWPKD